MSTRTHLQASSASTGTVTAAPEAAVCDEVVELRAEELQAIARALADPSRFAILQQIAASDATMCSNLHAQENLSPATISHHLRELQEAGLVDSRRDGRRMCLKLRRPVWSAYLRYLQHL